MLQKTIALPSSRLRLQVWDIPASPWLRDFVPSYITDASAVVVVYSIADRSSFEAAAAWAALAQAHAAQGAALPLLLVGTHADQAGAGSGARPAVVSAAEAEAAAASMGALASLRVCAREEPQATGVFCTLARHHDALYWSGMQEQHEGGDAAAGGLFDGMGGGLGGSSHLEGALPYINAMPLAQDLHVPPGAIGSSGRGSPESGGGGGGDTALSGCCSLPDATARAIKGLLGLFLSDGGAPKSGGPTSAEKESTAVAAEGDATAAATAAKARQDVAH